MGGIFGVASKTDCVTDLFFGTDYHSHLGNHRGGMATYNGSGFMRAIHNIENSPFRTKFERDVTEMKGYTGIGCISDSDPQPLLIRSGLGSFAICTVGLITNAEYLINKALSGRGVYFQEMSDNHINQTEMVAALINTCNSITDGIKYAQSVIEGSMSMLIMTHECIYAARDKLGRTPLMVGERRDDGVSMAHCVSFESFAYLNLGYRHKKELGPGEIVIITPDSVQMLSASGAKMKICAFLWTYYGYPTSSYEEVNVETTRYRCGALLSEDDNNDFEFVAGVPDSGTAYAIGYANASGVPFARPFIKYTPTWPRSFIPQDQRTRNLIAKMKIIPVHDLIHNKNLLFVEDSIVRGTQLNETVDFLYSSGARHVHLRSGCPPVMFSCKYLNFSRSSSHLDLLTRRTINQLEGGDSDDDVVSQYVNHLSDKYSDMVALMCRNQKFTSLKFQTLKNMLDAIGIDNDKVCTYCWSGIE